MKFLFRPEGGLGNQLFAYALAKRIERHTGFQPVADLSAFVGYEWHTFELDSFDSSIGSTVEMSSALHSLKQIRAARGAVSFVERRFPAVFEGLPVFQDSLNWQETLFSQVTSLHRYSVRKPAATPYLFLVRGYFQDIQFMSEEFSVIRDELLRVSEPTEWYQRMFTELGAERFISLHVRRGNFVGLSRQNVLPDFYYEKALSMLDEMLGAALPVVVFSDDIDAAREIAVLSRRKDTTFIVAPKGIKARPVEELNLMSLGSHAVIANSTYSLWAAALSQNSGGRVIAPRPMSLSYPRDERKMLLPSWVSLGY